MINILAVNFLQITKFATQNLAISAEKRVLRLDSKFRGPRKTSPLVTIFCNSDSLFNGWIFLLAGEWNK